ASSTLTRWRTLRSMPAITGVSSCSAVRPIFPSPRARSVPRWRWVWPIWLRTCVSFNFATCRAHLHSVVRLRRLRGLDRRLVGEHLADRLAAGLGDVLRPAELAERLLGRLQHVDRVRRSERLGEHVADAAEL